MKQTTEYATYKNEQEIDQITKQSGLENMRKIWYENFVLKRHNTSVFAAVADRLGFPFAILSWADMIMKNQSQQYIVRPLGKLGHAFWISRNLFYAYLAVTVCMYISLCLLLALKLIFSESCPSFFLKLCSLDPNSGFLIFIVATAVRFKIGYMGKIASHEEANQKFALSDSSAQKMRRVAACVLSSILLIFLGLSIQARLLDGRAIPGWGWVLFAVCACVLFYNCKTLNNKGSAK